MKTINEQCDDHLLPRKHIHGVQQSTKTYMVSQCKLQEITAALNQS